MRADQFHAPDAPGFGRGPRAVAAFRRLADPAVGPPVGPPVDKFKPGHEMPFCAGSFFYDKTEAAAEEFVAAKQFVPTGEHGMIIRKRAP